MEFDDVVDNPAPAQYDALEQYYLDDDDEIDDVDDVVDQEQLEDDLGLEDGGPRCQGCGCSSTRPCLGGCVWATETLCSQCVV